MGAMPDVHVQIDGALATVVLDNPDRRNAQTPATWTALTEIGDTLPDAVRVVVVRGEGPSFCGGMDRRMLTPEGVPGEESLLDLLAGSDSDLAERIAGFQRAFSWLRRPELISVAAVHGHAVGAGFQLALACDLRVLADDARLRMLEPALGLVPDLGGTRPLVELVGYARALEIVATARWVDAQEAGALGLATVVVPAAELAATVSDLAAALLASPREAVAASKRLLQQALVHDPDTQLRAERTAQVARLRALAAALGAPPAG